MNKISKNLSEYNGIVKESDKIYRHAVKALGISDSAFWILYALRDASSGITQSDIGNIIYFPMQTINSALKKLETDGYVKLCNVNDKRKKQVYLTEKGEQLAKRTVDRVIELETETMESLTLSEQEIFLSIFRKYTDILGKKFSTLNEENIKIEQL